MTEPMKSYTHIALVLDASGSMTRLRESTIDAMKDFFLSLKSPEDKTVVDVWQFNGQVRHLIDGMEIGRGADEAIENYATGGRTALYDAICTGIDELGKKFAAMSENDRPDAVVFAILTDGFENASKDFTAQDVKVRIAHQTEKYNWTFRFLAANQDAVLAGGRIGIARSACANFTATDIGMRQMCLSRMFDIGNMRERARVVRVVKTEKRTGV